jgi:hypothetical protein
VRQQGNFDFIRIFTSMIDLEHQIQRVTNFQDLVSTPFQGAINAICWERKLIGDFAEIVEKVALNDNITVLDEAALRALPLSEQGQLAREILLNDLKLLTAHGAAPVLNIIKCYDRDDTYPFFPTDVYSFHVDRSPIATDTFLCTYYGDPSEILPNSEAIQKILLPEIREGLKKLYDGHDEGFEAFLVENFFDLHYQAQRNALPISLGMGHLWKLAVDHPESKVRPCVHRAPKEKTNRLLLIC